MTQGAHVSVHAWRVLLRTGAFHPDPQQERSDRLTTASYNISCTRRPPAAKLQHRESVARPSVRCYNLHPLYVHQRGNFTEVTGKRVLNLSNYSRPAKVMGHRHGGPITRIEH